MRWAIKTGQKNQRGQKGKMGERW